MNLRCQCAPSFKRSARAIFLDLLHCAIDGHPRHDLRMRKMLARSTHLPDTLVWLLPSGFEESHQLSLQSPRIFVFVQTGVARNIQGVHDLAIDVELELQMRGVANTYWPAALIAGKP